LSGGSFTPIDVPGSSFTYVTGINDGGQIVGFFQDASGTHGFLATLQTPSMINY
jgi:quercetin dioxygenase-like cupin family protein